MSAIVNSLPYTGYGIDSGGYFTGLTGLKFPALWLGVSGSEVQQPTAGPALAGGATLTLVEATHNGKLIKLDTAAGTIVTLPASTGNGARYRFIVSVLATSNSHIVKVANATDVMRGLVFTMDDTAANAEAYATASTSDTITLNRTTTGSVSLGEYIDVEDFAAGFFRVLGHISNTGSSATPFSATV